MRSWLYIISIEQWFSSLLSVLEFFVRNTLLGGNVTTVTAGLLLGEEGWGWGCASLGLVVGRVYGGACAHVREGLGTGKQ